MLTCIIFRRPLDSGHYLRNLVLVSHISLRHNARVYRREAVGHDAVVEILFERKKIFMTTRTTRFYDRFGREAYKDVNPDDSIVPNVFFRLDVCLGVLNELIDLCEKRGLTIHEVRQLSDMLKASAS